MFQSTQIKTWSLKIVGLCLTLAFIACTSNTDPTTAAYWIDRLDDKQERIKALKELGKIGDPSAVDAVTEWMKKDGKWQPDAAYALGQLGDKKVVPELVAAMDFQVGAGSDRLSRLKNRINVNAARALANLKATEQTDALLRLAGSNDKKVRQSVIEALGDMGDKKATPLLSKAATKDEEPFIRKTAIQSLGDIADPAGAPALVEMLYKEMPGISFFNEARFSLIQIGKDAVPLLIKTLKRENPTIEAIRMANGEPIWEGAVEAKAASVLGSMEAGNAEGLMLEKLKFFNTRLKSGKGVPASVPGAIVELCYALSDMRSEKAIPVILDVSRTNNTNLRVAATEALTALGQASVAKELFEIAKTGDQGAKYAAVVAATRLGSGDMLNEFDAVIAKFPDWKRERVRLESAKECGNKGECWKKKLSDKNSRVRERAAYQLGWLNEKTAVDGLLKAMEDDSAQVRMAAVKSLEQLPGVKPDVLLSIYNKWKDKLDYRGVNNEILRVAAVLKNKQRG